jgi:hypothetical protein
MRTWRLCFRNMIEKPNAPLGWMVPLQPWHIDQYLEDKRNHLGWGVLSYYTSEGSEFKRCGDVCAGMDIEGMYVYEQYITVYQQYATGCYGDCVGYRFMLCQKLVALLHNMQQTMRSITDPDMCAMFMRWRDDWLKRAWLIMWSRGLRKQDCVWAGMPRDLTRWFIENYVDADVWKLFEYRRVAPAQLYYNFALYPGEMQPSGHMGETAKEFLEYSIVATDDMI